MAVIVYNKNHEEHYGDNVFYIGRGSDIVTGKQIGRAHV